ncbi:MAG TPA: hypothetical protein VH061_10230 [Solirubrobacteraceae bacterium]|jgi:hypothetical protein|nr:hypothetical protein [Solirubrobacteraceae bacterium]
MGRKLLMLAVFAIASLTSVSSALAVTHHPKGAFAPFADCPLSNKEITTCLNAKTETGKFIVGNETVPIKNTITLQGGLFETGETVHFVAAEDGNTLSKTPQPVPGGLLGLVKCNEISNFIERIACEVTFENGVTGVNATTELAGPASSIGVNLANLVDSTGTALSLPVKVHLENPFLGSECYIGSNAHPVTLQLTTGTTSPPAPNKPITGNPGKLEFKEEFQIIEVQENSLVNNSFPAPGAEGCGGIFSFLIDPIVDAKLGLPSAAGHNTAILSGTLKETSPAAVKAHE